MNYNILIIGSMIIINILLILVENFNISIHFVLKLGDDCFASFKILVSSFFEKHGYFGFWFLVLVFVFKINKMKNMISSKMFLMKTI